MNLSAQSRFGVRWMPAGASWQGWWAGFVWIGLAIIAAGNDASPSVPPPPPSRWALSPLVRSTVPLGTNHPIDAFIKVLLSNQKLKPSPSADRRTLLRRLNYDLTGLPPTPEEVGAFERDQSPDAYLKQVDRLLGSPRYGEAWARHWLDVVHYADTHGNDHDYARPNAWPYRDYVIASLNQDKPYRRFVREQVAGDALFPEDPQATVALGFLAAGPWDETLMVGVREDTFDHHLAQVLDRDDMVTTVMSTFQGLTVHCARCHDHKFDPITQREYYGLQAVFAGIDRADRLFDDDPALHQRRQKLLARKRILMSRDPTQLATLLTPEVLQRVEEFSEQRKRREAAWHPLDIVSVVSATSPDTLFARQPDGSWFVSGAKPVKDTFIVTAVTRTRGIRAVRLEALPDDRLPGKGPGRYEPSGNFHLSEFRVEAQPRLGATSGLRRLEIIRATADHSDGGDAIANAIDGRLDTHWSVHPRYGEAHEAVFELKEPLDCQEETTLVFRLEHQGTTGHQLGRFRLGICTDALPADQRPPLSAKLNELLRKSIAHQGPEERQELALQVLLGEVEAELARLPEPRRVFAVGRDFPPNGSLKPAALPRAIHLLKRGDLNQPGEEINPVAPACLPQLQGVLSVIDPKEESGRRAALASWLTDDRNVLTWRTVVNRVWHYHFGRGLCDSPNDLGAVGGKPSHPELLDWLAVWFRDDAKGSLKALHRLILTSETWQQSVSHDVTAEGVDPENRLLWRMNRTRLTAEQLRDSLLSFSGDLDLTMGGPPVVQFVDRGKATFMPDGGAPAFLDYEHFSPDSPAHRRRAIYRFVFRTVPDPWMEALDAPDGGALTPVRNISTTPVQAFALLNNPFLIRQCERIAQRLERSEPASLDARMVQLFQRLLQRDPTATERSRWEAYVGRHGLANAVQMLINANETLYLD